MLGCAALGRLVPAWLVATCVVLGINAAGAAAEPPRSFTSEELFTALIEPNLRADGRLSEEARVRIHQVAARMLAADQLAELDARLKSLTTGPAFSQPVAHLADGDPAPAPRPPVPAEQVMVAPSCCADANDCGAPAAERLLDNLWVFAGLDGSKQPQDLGINANMGGRFEVNWGIPLVKSLGIGVQVGTSENYHQDAVHVLDQVQGTHDRWQNFTTVGLFQRTDVGFKWGVVYDFMHERYYDSAELTQWRGQVGYEVNDRNEFGSWFTITDRHDTVFLLGTPLHLEALSQANFYWQHTWDCHALTSVWLGVAEGHGRTVATISNDPPTRQVLTYGASVFIPLGKYVALYGAANFLTPADTGTVDAYLGFALFPGGGARQATRNRFAPLLPVANSPYFAVDLRP